MWVRARREVYWRQRVGDLKYSLRLFIPTQTRHDLAFDPGYYTTDPDTDDSCCADEIIPSFKKMTISIPGAPQQ